MSTGQTEGAPGASPKQAKGQGNPQNQIGSGRRIKSIKSTKFKSTFVKLLPFARNVNEGRPSRCLVPESSTDGRQPQFYLRNTL